MSRQITALMLFGLSFFAIAGTDYLLGAGDQIRIQVYEENDLSMSLRLSESGEFNYPYLGILSANGKTTDQLEVEVTEGLLQDVLVNPSVSISITSYRNFYIGGEVRKSGGYSYHPGLTVKQAITLAGGVTEWASSSKFEILREGHSKPVSASDNTLVKPGDTVTILEGIF